MYSVDDIRRRLKSFNPEERRVAVVMIGKARYHDMLDALIAVLKYDSDEEVRAMAAWSIDLMTTPEAVPALLEALYDDVFGVRSNAGWALVHLAQRVMPQLVVPEVIDVLRDESHPGARQMAYLVLSRINDSAAQEALKRYW